MAVCVVVEGGVITTISKITGPDRFAVIIDYDITDGPNMMEIPQGEGRPEAYANVEIRENEQLHPWIEEFALHTLLQGLASRL